MNKDIYIGCENPSKLGIIEIDRNLITSIDLNFRNPNFPEVFAGAQSKYITKKKDCNYFFELERISKADFPFKQIKNNYYLNSQDLSFKLPEKFANLKLSIKLNYLEYLKIKYHKKQTLYHEINPKKKFLEYLIVGFPLLLIGFLLRGCYDKVVT